MGLVRSCHHLNKPMLHLWVGSVLGQVLCRACAPRSSFVLGPVALWGPAAPDMAPMGGRPPSSRSSLTWQSSCHGVSMDTPRPVYPVEVHPLPQQILRDCSKHKTSTVS